MEDLSLKKGFLGYDASQNVDPKVVVVPFGLEKTVSYGGGTKNGPKEIIKASPFQNAPSSRFREVTK